MQVVNAFARVLLHMHPLDTHGDRLTAVEVHQHLALADDRVLVLGNLVALRQVRIEVVLPVKDGVMIDLRLQPQPGADRLLHAESVDHGQHAGHGRVDEADLAVRLRAESGRGAAEQFGVRNNLGVNLEADYDLPRPGAALKHCHRRAIRRMFLSTDPP